MNSHGKSKLNSTEVIKNKKKILYLNIFHILLRLNSTPIEVLVKVTLNQGLNHFHLFSDFFFVKLSLFFCLNIELCARF